MHKNRRKFSAGQANNIYARRSCSGSLADTAGPRTQKVLLFQAWPLLARFLSPPPRDWPFPAGEGRARVKAFFVRLHGSPIARQFCISRAAAALHRCRRRRRGRHTGGRRVTGPMHRAAAYYLSVDVEKLVPGGHSLTDNRSVRAYRRRVEP